MFAYRDLVYCGHYVAEDSELEEEAELDTSFKHLFNLVLSRLIDNSQSFKAVAEELNLSSYKASCLPEDKLNEIKF